MRQPSGKMRRASVTLTYNGWVVDQDYGRVQAVLSTVTGVLCSVNPVAPSREVGEDSGIRALTAYSLHFTVDPALNVDDVVTWVDPYSSVTHTIKIAGGMDSGGRGISFVYPGVERV